MISAATTPRERWWPSVDQGAHDVGAAGQQDHRNQGERDPEGEHDLGGDECAGGVEHERKDDPRRVIVTARRTNSGMRRLMNPRITTWPAEVPTKELDRPEASNATAKASAAPRPISRLRPACAPSMLSMPVLPVV
jgi:hypothetical protein